MNDCTNIYFKEIPCLLGADPFHSGFTVEVNVVFCFKSSSFSSSNQHSRSCLEMLRLQGERFTLTSSSEHGTGNLPSDFQGNKLCLFAPGHYFKIYILSTACLILFK